MVFFLAATLFTLLKLSGTSFSLLISSYYLAFLLLNNLCEFDLCLFEWIKQVLNHRIYNCWVVKVTILLFTSNLFHEL